jgi:hypothetical protein
MTRSDSAPETPRGGLAGGLFLISVAILALQVLQTRILSVQMWHHHSYMVVTMTLLGFGVAGALVTLAPGLVRERLRRNLAWAGTLFALSTLGGYLLLGATADRAAEMTAQGNYVALSLFYSYLLIPYFFGGLVVTLVLSAEGDVHRLYFVNLVGSAVGAWVFIGAITPLGAERLLVLCAATGPLAAVAFLRGAGGERGSGTAFGGALGVLALCAVVFARAEEWLRVDVATSKAEHKILHGRESTEGAELLESVWTPMCRLDFVKLPEKKGVPTPVNIYQDGDAITVMHSDASWETVPKAALNTLAYVPHALRRQGTDEPGPEALAIGIGGGIDLRYALSQEASSILGIEINATTVEKVGKDYADFNGDVYHRPGVEVVVGEGRSTLRRLDRKFDVIELSGTDTYTAGNSGAYVLSESYLYTAEALREYFAHLTDRGTLGIIRLAYDPPRETLRLFALALEELRARGVEKPSDHAVVIYEEVHDPEVDVVVRFAAGVFSMEPFAQDAIDYYKLADHSPIFRVAYYPGMEAENPFTELGAAIDAGTEQAFYDSYYWDVSPVVDDSPFFFNFHHWSALFGEPAEKDEEWYLLTGGPVGLEILATLLVQTSLLTGVLVVLPLFLLRRRGLATPHAWRHLGYFLALGAGFMFLEISTIQRLVLYLGHPTYSLTVTLCCFLFFAGLGSLWARRLDASPARALRVVVPLLAGGIVLVFLGLDHLLDATLALSFAARVAVVVAVLAPLNFLMGIPFPVGLARLKLLAPNLVPWALGANGGASVVGSILCIVVAMESGFRSVSLLAAAIYLGGTLLVTTGPLSPRRSGG